MNKITRVIFSSIILILKIAYLIFLVFFFMDGLTTALADENYLFGILDLVFDIYIVFTIIVSILNLSKSINKIIFRIGFVTFTLYFIISGLIANDVSTVSRDIAEWLTYITIFLPMFFINFRFAFKRKK